MQHNGGQLDAAILVQLGIRDLIQLFRALV
jgi:hypothetical protein